MGTSPASVDDRRIAIVDGGLFATSWLVRTVIDGGLCATSAIDPIRPTNGSPILAGNSPFVSPFVPAFATLGIVVCALRTRGGTSGGTAPERVLIVAGQGGPRGILRSVRLWISTSPSDLQGLVERPSLVHLERRTRRIVLVGRLEPMGRLFVRRA
jgi:hypothetical protein